MAQEGIALPASDFVDELFKNVLGTLIVEKTKEENKKFAREIAVTITQTEQAYAYFKVYVQPNLEEK